MREPASSSSPVGGGFRDITDVFFDLDHTLWDFDRNSGLTFRALLPQRFPEVSIDAFLEVYEPTNRAYWSRYQAGQIDRETLRYGRLSDSFRAVGEHPTDAEIEWLSTAYLEGLATHPHLVPGARELLEYLAPRYRLHIITNGFAQVQARKLANADIAHFFDHVVDSDRAGTKKPDPRIYRMALELAGVSPSRSVMIGDDLEADVIGARAQGMAAVHFDTLGEGEHGQAPVISRLSELMALL